MGINQVEKNLIEIIRERSHSDDGIPGLGIGDDAAFLLLSSMEEGKLIISTDSVVENVHYKQEWCSYADVAIKLVERASSDILAKGGHPHWALLNMNITEDFSKDKTLYGMFIDALCEKLKEHHVALIGGDITRSDTNTFTMTVLGNTSTFIRRANEDIKAGDVVVMWGKIGGSSSAIDEFAIGSQPDNEMALYYRRPEACWHNEWLTGLHCKVSMDQSDSVLETLETLSNDNKIHLKINLDQIPLSMKTIQGKRGETIKNILRAAEDLAIIAVIPSSEIENVKQFKEITIIGEVIKKISLQNNSGLVSFFWQNEEIEMDYTSKDFYEHF